MSDKPFGPSSTFGRARRREAYRRLADVVRRRKPKPLLDLDDVGKRLRVFEQTYVGIRPIPVSRIVGTLGRTSDFDREFLPRRGNIQSRWERVERVFDQGDFPPITVFELGGSYFVVDGHHRVAVARQRGIDYIDAEITRLRSRWPLPPDADLGRIIMEEQRQQFMEDSGLERARPEVRIEFSRPQGYIELLEQIKVHGYNLMMQRGEMLTPEEIAADWYDRVYLPTVEAIKHEGLWELFPKATKADLFLWVTQRRRELFPERGGMETEEAVRAARDTSPKPATLKPRLVKRPKEE